MLEKNERPMQAASGSSLRGTIENKAVKPAGLLPKNTQQLVILAVAIVMVLVMWLTGGNKRPVKSNAGTPGSAAVRPPDAATVQDFKRTIQKEQAATRQPIAPADLARLEALHLAGDVPRGAEDIPPVSTVPQPGSVIGGTTQQGPPADPIKEDRKKREYLSLFAPNVAFTSRAGEEASRLLSAQTKVANPGGDALLNASGATSDPEAQVRASATQLSPVSGTVEQAPRLSQTDEILAEAKPRNPDVRASAAFNSYSGKRFVLFEGTVLESLLVNRLNGTFAGPVDCLLTNDIYSHDRQHVLIPAGTKILGEAKKVEGVGQQRLVVVFHRLVMPDGFSVSLDGFKGLNQIGETALRDKVNNHYLQLFGTSLAIGVLGGIAQAGTGNDFTSSPLDRARAGLGSSIANSSMQILDKFLNILPTVTIREGSRIKVYLAGDLLLPDYAAHTMDQSL
jgi:type IV secretion system protein TrbI